MFPDGESVLRRSGETGMEDVDYLRTRIREESEAAKRSTQDRVRLRHLELAAAYEFRITSIMRISDARTPRLHAVEASAA
jgi:hypothetical protein